MNSSTLHRDLAQLDARALADRMAADLDVPSPRLGAKGPPSFSGPDDLYLEIVRRAIANDKSVSERVGKAIKLLLLQEAGTLAGSAAVGRPLLLFNLTSILQGVRLLCVVMGLRALREFRDELRLALRKYDEDLYLNLLTAHAVNQEGTADLGFWLNLLKSTNLGELRAAVLGIRKSGLENACQHLPQVERKFREYPALGDFNIEVMLLVDAYPDRNWPVRAQEFFPDTDQDSRIPELIRKHAADRYVPSIEDLPAPPRSAVAIVKEAQRVKEVEQRHKSFEKQAPTNVLVDPRRQPRDEPRELAKAPSCSP